MEDKYRNNNIALSHKDESISDLNLLKTRNHPKYLTKLQNIFKLHSKLLISLLILALTLIVLGIGIINYFNNKIANNSNTEDTSDNTIVPTQDIQFE